MGIAKVNMLVRVGTTHLILGAACRLLSAAVWICRKVFDIPTSHVLIVVTDPDTDGKLLHSVQECSVDGRHMMAMGGALADHLGRIWSASWWPAPQLEVELAEEAE